MTKAWRRACIPLLFLILALGAANPVSAASLHDPALTWQTLHTPHFAIHFHDGEEDLARRLAGIAEPVHHRLAERLRWQPRERTDVVLLDRMDLTNGWATPFPGNHITILTIPPSDVATLEDYDDWLTLVFTHEYTHTLHLDKARGAPKGLRQVFGRMPLLFPNLFQPNWITEGLATHVETDLEHGVGRGQSSLFRAMMRLEWLEGIKPLAQVNAGTTEWPRGAAAYLYGVYFYNFLAAQYGEERIAQWIDGYSQNLLPFFINTTSRATLGKDLASLWTEFDAYLAQEFSGEVEQIRALGLTSSTALTRSGLESGYAQAMPNGDLYYIEDSDERRATLMRLPAGGAAPQPIAEVRGAQFHAHPRAGILLVQVERTRNTNWFNDLYRIDPVSGATARLTHGGRYQKALWHPDGDHIIAVHYALGRQELRLLDARGAPLKTLWSGAYGDVIGGIDIDAAGARLVASLKRCTGSWNLAMFDLASGQWQPITEGAAIEMQPRFVGQHEIVYSADYDGVFNIYRHDLATGEHHALTRQLGAASYPSVSADGQRLYFNQLGPRGYDLHWTPLTQLAAAPPAASAVPAPIPARDETARITAYQPATGLWPVWWFPYWYLDEQHNEFGATTSGTDPLRRHYYEATIGYDTKRAWPLGYVYYRYDRWQPSLSLFASRTKDIYLNADGSLRRIRDDDEVHAYLERPFLFVDHQWALHLGLVYENEKDAERGPTAAPMPSFKSSLGGIALSHNSSRFFPRGISPVDGRVINLTHQWHDVFGGVYNGETTQLDWREYLRLPGRHVFSARLAAGLGERGTPAYSLGGTMADPITLPGAGNLPPPFNKRDFPLRGYDDGLPQLIGDNMALFDLQWRFPLRRVERTAMAPPIGLSQLSGALFYNTGTVWDEHASPDQWYAGVGGELHSDLILGYLLPLRLTLGYAHGLDEIGEDQFYLRLSGAF
ncbi:MAG: hypothetical protein AB1810_02695 [Pseudomonadota bacterium]